MVKWKKIKAVRINLLYLSKNKVSILNSNFTIKTIDTFLTIILYKILNKTFII